MARRSPRRARSLSPRSARRGRPRRLTLLLLAFLLVVLGAVALERAGRLPEPVADVVREAEAAVLAPLLRELGVEWPETTAAERSPAPGPAMMDDRAAVAKALAQLDGLRVEPERRRGYMREDWPHWLDVDGDCVDARHEALAAESLEPARLTSDGCAVAAGLWRDLFTGETVRDPSALDVDHMVPLAEAHRSGGYAWSRERRAAYANDLQDPRALVAVTAAANRAKSDQGPEDWLPPEPSYRCRYAAEWVAVKARWGLSMDERERASVGNLLEACTRG